MIGRGAGGGSTLAGNAHVLIQKLREIVFTCICNKLIKHVTRRVARRVDIIFDHYLSLNDQLIFDH